jgi:hypothetical protein
MVRTVGASVWTDEQAIPAPDVLMFLRADEDASGRLVICGKAHGDGRGWLWREAGQTWVDLGPTYGNNCLETDGTRVYVQRSLTSYDVIDLTPGGTSYMVTCAPTSQGFCDCTSPLSIMSDDARSAIPHVYRPQYAGPWFVGGARESFSVLAVSPDGVPALLENGVSPVEEVRAVWVGDEIIACAYVASGVWTWRGRPTVIPTTPTWYVDGTWVDALPYVVPDDIDAPAPRVLSVDGVTPGLQTWRDPANRQQILRLKFGDPHALEGYRWDDTHIHLAFDATDGKGPDHAWRYVPDRWVPRAVKVGETYRDTPQHIVRKNGDGPSTIEHNSFATRIHAAGEGLDLGGSLGVCKVLVIAAIPDPGLTVDGYEERHWFAISLDGATRYGLVRYEEVRHGVVVADRSATINRILSGASVRPAAPPVIPDPPPVIAPPQEAPVKTRDQFYDEFKQVNEFYQSEDGLQRPGGMVLSDGRCDAEAMAAWGYALLAENQSVAAVKHQIVRSQEWKDKHPGVETPSFL